MTYMKNTAVASAMQEAGYVRPLDVFENHSYVTVQKAVYTIFEDHERWSTKGMSKQERLFTLHYALLMTSATKSELMKGALKNCPEIDIDKVIETLLAIGAWRKLRVKNGEVQYCRTDKALVLLHGVQEYLESQERKQRTYGSALAKKCLEWLDSVHYIGNSRVHGWAKEAFMSGRYEEQLIKKPALDDDGNEKGRPVNVGKLVTRAHKMLTEPVTMNHNFEHRGRCNTEGSLVNYQGNSHFRSFLDFAVPYKAGERTLCALELAAADKIGCKGSYLRRRASGKKALTEQPLSAKAWAHEPMLTRYALAYKVEVPKHGETGVVIYQDATASGLQNYGLLFRDDDMCRATNLYHADENTPVHDVYEAITAITGDRDAAKALIMPWLYGGGRDMLINKVAPANGLNIEQVDLFLSAVKEAFPVLHSFKKYMWKECEEFHANGHKRFEWVMPDGFKVVINKRDWAKIEVRCGNLHTYLKSKVPPYHKGKTAAALLAGIVHSLDAYIMRLVVGACANNDWKVATIHDSFGTTGEAYTKLNLTIRHAYYQCHKEIDGSKLLTEIFKQPTPLHKGDYKLDTLMKAKNLFC